MRTNVVLDDALVDEAMRYSNARTKRGLIEEALTTFVRVKNEEKRRATYESKLRALERRLSGLCVREAPSEVLRRSRDSR